MAVGIGWQDDAGLRQRQEDEQDLEQQGRAAEERDVEAGDPVEVRVMRHPSEGANAARIVAKKIEVTARNSVSGTPIRMNGIALRRNPGSTVTVMRMNPTRAATMMAHMSRNFARQTCSRRSRACSISVTSC